MEYITFPSTSWKFRDLFAALCCNQNAENNLNQELRRIYDVKYIRLMNLGRAAISIGLKALGLGKGDEVIVQGIICPTVIRAIVKAGCRPIFCDVSDNLHASVLSLDRAFTEKTKAVIVPHLYSMSAPIGEICDWASYRKIMTIDDAAQAVGLKKQNKYLGTFGDIGIISFGPFKNLGISRGGGLLIHSSKHYKKSDIDFLRESRQNIAKRMVSCYLKHHWRSHYLTVKNVLQKDVRKTTEAILNTTSPSFESFGDDAYELSKIESNLIYHTFKRVGTILIKRRKMALRLHNSIRHMNRFKMAGPPDAPYVKIPIRLRGITAYKAVHYLRNNRIEAERIYTPVHLIDKYKPFCEYRLENAEKEWNNIFLIPNPVNHGKLGLDRIAKALLELKKICD